jgi:large subunit ribosomal protein L28
MKCDNCGKATTFGRAVSHSKRATNRPFRANLQKITVYDERLGRAVQKVMCAKCIKAMGKVTKK